MVGAVSVERHFIAGSVKRDTLAISNLNSYARLDGQISRNGEIIAAWVDSDWAVGCVPCGVLSNVRGDICTLAFERHGSVVDTAI